MIDLEKMLAQADGRAVVRRDGEIIAQWGQRKSNIRFSVASLSKQFVGVATLILIRSSKLTLDTPLAAVFRDGPAWWSEVTVRQLLSHTAALGHWDRVGGMDSFARVDENEPWRRVCALEPLHAPGDVALQRYWISGAEQGC